MPLEVEKAFLDEIRSSLSAISPDHFAVVHNRELIGVYATVEEAYSEAVKKLGLVSVLIRKLSEPEQQVSIPALALGVLSANNSPPTGG
jgi:hypothetical protein